MVTPEYDMKMEPMGSYLNQWLDVEIIILRYKPCKWRNRLLRKKTPISCHDTWVLGTWPHILGRGQCCHHWGWGVRTPAGQWSPDTAGTPTWSHPHPTWSLSSQSCHCKHVSFQAHCTSLLMLLLAILSITILQLQVLWQ